MSFKAGQFHLNNLAKFFAAAPSQDDWRPHHIALLAAAPHQEKVLEAIEEIKVQENKAEEAQGQIG